MSYAMPNNQHHDDVTSAKPTVLHCAVLCCIVQALEVEKQQAASTAEAAKAAIEARLRAVTAEAAEATGKTGW